MPEVRTGLLPVPALCQPFWHETNNADNTRQRKGGTANIPANSGTRLQDPTRAFAFEPSVAMKLHTRKTTWYFQSYYAKKRIEAVICTTTCKTILPHTHPSNKIHHPCTGQPHCFHRKRGNSQLFSETPENPATCRPKRQEEFQETLNSESEILNPKDPYTLNPKSEPEALNPPEP